MDVSCKSRQHVSRALEFCSSPVEIASVKVFQNLPGLHTVYQGIFIPKSMFQDVTCAIRCCLNPRNCLWTALGFRSCLTYGSMACAGTCSQRE